VTIVWQRWLTGWAMCVGVFGLILYGAGYPSTTGPAAALFSVLGQPLPADPDRYLRFTTALMGAVTLGWAVTFYAAFRDAWSLGRPASAPVWRVLTLAAVVWYLIDSAASVANGFAMNAVSNTILLICYLVPVIASGAMRKSG